VLLLLLLNPAQVSVRCSAALLLLLLLLPPIGHNAQDQLLPLRL
jgi:hypothetical protein